MKRRGFTLVELLIAIGIFAIIAMATVRNIQQIALTKRIAMRDVDLYNAVRSAVSMIRNDLSQTFHVLYEDLGPDAKAQLDQSQPVPHTLFDGRKKELIFTSLSRRVYYANLRECEQTEVSYFLQTQPGQASGSLMKRESPVIDADLYQGGKVFTLVDGVTQMEFQYWDVKQGKWLDDWNSDAGELRDRFPAAVKMKLTVKAEDGTTIALEPEFKIAFPNNEQLLVKF